MEFNMMKARPNSGKSTHVISHTCNGIEKWSQAPLESTTSICFTKKER